MVPDRQIDAFILAVATKIVEAGPEAMIQATEHDFGLDVDYAEYVRDSVTDTVDDGLGGACGNVS